MVNLRSCMGGLCLIFAAGCSVAPAFQPEATPLTYEESMAHCEQLNQERPAIESLRSLAESTISHSGDSISFRYVIVTREPKDLRIDLLPMEGAFTLGLLVTQGEHILLLNTQDKTYLETEDRAAVLERFLGIRGITREMIIAIVSGIAPHFDCSQVEILQGQDGESVAIDRVQHVAWDLAGNTGRVSAFYILNNEHDTIESQGALYYSGNASPSSMSLALYQPLEAQGIMLFKKVVINPVIADEIFTIAVPGDYSEER